MSVRTIIGFLFIATCLVSCHEPTAEEVAKSTLQEALEALHREDFDGYLAHVDFGAPMETEQTAYMKDALRRHLGWLQSERPAVVSVDMIDIQMNGDSVCTVYCQYSYADNTKEVVAQKMVRNGEKWKIRLRN